MLTDCIAYVLKIPHSHHSPPPHFNGDAHRFWKEINAWIGPKYTIISVSTTYPPILAMLKGPIIVSSNGHSKVWKDGNIIYDPEPDIMVSLDSIEILYEVEPNGLEILCQELGKDH